MPDIKSSNTIDGVHIHDLNVISDDRGSVLHMMRSDSINYQKFGEVYFSELNPGAIKAWKKHLIMTQNITVPRGVVEFILYDDRINSPTKSELVRLTIGRPDNYKLLTIPAGIWYGFRALNNESGLLANITDMIHDPGETERLEWNSEYIPYVWK